MNFYRHERSRASLWAVAEEKSVWLVKIKVLTGDI